MKAFTTSLLLASICGVALAAPITQSLVGDGAVSTGDVNVGDVSPEVRTRSDDTVNGVMSELKSASKVQDVGSAGSLPGLGSLGLRQADVIGGLPKAPGVLNVVPGGAGGIVPGGLGAPKVGSPTGRGLTDSLKTDSVGLGAPKAGSATDLASTVGQAVGGSGLTDSLKLGSVTGAAPKIGARVDTFLGDNGLSGVEDEAGRAGSRIVESATGPVA
ncbi:hypothetical protein NQ176_g6065 [Zarea fungicola]|uniref:Uncharacterized protein n=1 Tax=Zarea fungicola TaxID=93591 RepID=A0ACC1N568_9HYPO|nr:hypothetical protein NQ176_g6065 [Lecanicillium fungicola]